MWLDKKEIQASLLSKISSRNCTELIDAMMKFRKEHHVDITLLGPNNRNVLIDTIIEQNRTSLFDSHQLIEDWWAEQNCSNHEKRSRLRRAANEPNGKQDEKGNVNQFDINLFPIILPFSQKMLGKSQTRNVQL